MFCDPADASNPGRPVLSIRSDTLMSLLRTTLRWDVIDVDPACRRSKTNVGGKGRRVREHPAIDRIDLIAGIEARSISGRAAANLLDPDDVECHTVIGNLAGAFDIKSAE